jgi:DNA helicase-2/ATP-dependent DNA helicase PcrA
MIDELREQENKISLSELVTQVLQQSGYKQYIEEQDIKQDEDRLENLKEFLVSVREYETMFQDRSLGNFLQRISLVSASDQKQEDEDSVTLMTLHAAKGLEFPCVYIVGAVDGIIPHKRSMSAEEIEEERRLFFVGITRAQRNLTISYTKMNLREHTYNDPSPFLEDIPKNITKFIKANQLLTL